MTPAPASDPPGEAVAWECTPQPIEPEGPVRVQTQYTAYAPTCRLSRRAAVLQQRREREDSTLLAVAELPNSEKVRRKRPGDHSIVIDHLEAVKSDPDLKFIHQATKKLAVLPKFFGKNFTIHISHQIFYFIYGALNVDK